VCRSAGWVNHFLIKKTCVYGRRVVTALRAAYGDSNAGMEDSAQSKFLGPNENEFDHSDDVDARDVESAPKKRKPFGSELRLHNSFFVPALQPTAEGKVQMAKDSDSSHVMHPNY
jgi:hypothetical protein